MNGFISPDFKANQYSVLQNAGMIDMNVEKHFSLSSVHGNGKIYIDGSEHGSRVTCVSDGVEPANGVAGCLRNYLRVQNYKTSYQDGSGILYTDMPPGKMLNFIKDLGMFTGFKEDRKE
jgi:hypothetical protein